MSKPIRLLLLEDRPADAGLLLEELRAQGLDCEARRVMREPEFLEALNAFEPDVILADYALPGYNGLAALDSAQKLQPEIPFIFVSGTLGEETAIEALHHGATDYVLKQRLSRLAPAVQRALSEARERRERARAEQQIAELNLLLRAIRGIDQLIVREREPERLLQKACEILVETRGYVFAWVGLADQNSKRVLPAAESGKGSGFLESITVTWDEKPTGQGPVGTAIRTGHPWICNDTHTDPRYAPWKDLAQARGFAAVASMPMLKAGRALGALTVYSGRKGAFVEQELDLLNELAADLAFALQNIEDENERRRAQDALRSSEQEFRSLFENMLNGFAYCQMLFEQDQPADFVYLAVNGAFEKLTGLKDVVGKKVSEVIPGFRQSDPALLELYGRVARTGVPERVELYVNALKHWFDIMVYRPRPDHFAAVFDVVTARKQAEARLACFARMGRSLSLATSPQMAAQTMADAASELLGWDACYLNLGSLEGGCLTPLVDFDTFTGQRVPVPIVEAARRPTAMFRRVLTEGAQLILRQTAEEAGPDLVPAGDPTRRSLSLMFVPIRKEGKPIGLLSVQSYQPGAYTVRDLETLQALADYGAVALVRLHAAEALRQSEAHLAEAQQLAHLGSWVTELHSLENLDQNPLRWSDEVFRIFGYEPGAFEVTRERFLQAVHPEDRAKVAAAVQQALRERQPYEIQHRIVRPDGTERVVHEHAEILFDEATGGPDKLIGMVQDVTDRKQLEAQLVQAQKLEAVGQLAGGLAHDLNNMLSVILGNAELLLIDAKTLSAETSEGLRRMYDAAERTAKLTRQLLIFSRKHAVQSRPVGLNELVDNMSKMLKRFIREDIEMHCLYSAKSPWVQADPGMLEQVLLNLVVNARDAMPAGGKLKVETELVCLDESDVHRNPEARPGTFACFKVSDSGTGISPEHLSHIFEPFFTTKDPDKGTGLGLAMVYGVVKQHQGWIEVDSRVAKGTTFRIFLPAMARPAPAPGKRRGETLRGGTETILLVEDDFAVRMITRRLLETFHYKVCEADSGSKALEVWSQHENEIALLLTDMVMPGNMTGRELAERLRALRPGMKVLFMSGYSAEMLGEHAEFFQTNKNHFLHKPFSSETLIRLVRRCLDEGVRREA
jgi:PAS domain S-box-containing protein